MKYIAIKGKRYPIDVNLLMIEDMCNDLGISFAEFDSKVMASGSIRMSLLFLLHAIRCGMGDKECDLTLKDIADDIGMDMAKFGKVMEQIATFFPNEKKTKQTRQTKRKAKV